MINNGIKHEKQDKCDIFIIEHFSDDLKCAIKNNLYNICWVFEKETPGVSFKDTIKEFIYRCEEKSESKVMGFISEFLVHILIKEYYENLSILTPFFNMEERSARKGFDIIIYNKNNNELIIDETKSGENIENDPTKSCLNIIKRAEKDLEKRAVSNDSKNKFIWMKAINETRRICENNSEMDAVKKEIDNLGKIKDSEKGILPNDINVLLAAVLFERVNNFFNKDAIYKKFEDIVNKKTFKCVYMIAIQENTYEEIYDYIKNELNYEKQ